MTLRVHLVHGGSDKACVIEAFSPSTKAKIWTTPKVLYYPGDSLTEYVHSGMSLLVREETEAEQKARREAAQAPNATPIGEAAMPGGGAK